MILFYFNCFVLTCVTLLRKYFTAKARVFYYDGRKERINSGSKEIIYSLNSRKSPMIKWGGLEWSGIGIFCREIGGTCSYSAVSIGRSNISKRNYEITFVILWMRFIFPD
jgi:hypothetical protein